jgi:hypothetical protein
MRLFEDPHGNDFRLLRLIHRYGNLVPYHGLSYRLNVDAARAQVEGG